MNKLSFLFLLASSLIAGCANNHTKFPIRIGLLADSQITSQDRTPGCVYGSKSLDKTFEYTIRPPALEYLAKDMLRIALDKLSEEDEKRKKVDVILYLGDGANSGGADEVNDLFTILADYRTKPPNTPIFMVIGNHDYLGAGNTPNKGERLLLVNDLRAGKKPPTSYNRPLTKYEVLKKISDFNKQSACLTTKFKYEDNSCSLSKKLDHDTGLYLAGHLKYTVQGEKDIEIFLADTSDYSDTPPISEPKTEVFKELGLPLGLEIEFYGLQGSISSKDKPDKSKLSQINYFKEKLALPSPGFRFIASHYHPDNLDRKRLTGVTPEHLWYESENFGHGIIETFLGIFGAHFPNRYLKSWLAKSGRNYWLSAHTHRETMMRPNQGKVHVGGILEVLTDASFRSVNIGSTTDYRAHVAVIEPLKRNETDNDIYVRKVDNSVQFREIPLFDNNKPFLKTICEAIGEYGINHCNDPNFRDLFKKWRKRKKIINPDYIGMTILGLNKEYQEDYWLPKHTTASKDHLLEFIDNRAKYGLAKYSRADVVTCLAFIAGACEAEVCNCEKGFDLNKCNLK